MNFLCVLAGHQWDDIYYLDGKGEECKADFKEIPSKCGDCPFSASREESFFDDIDDWFVDIHVLVCKANGMILHKIRKDRNMNYDHSVEKRVLGRLPSTCPLYQK